MKRRNKGLWQAVKRAVTPSPKQSDLEIARDILRLVRDYHLPEETIEAYMNIVIQLLISEEVGQDGYIRAVQREDLRERLESAVESGEAWVTRLIEGDTREEG